MKRNWLEWLVLAASGAAILLLVAILVSTALLSEGEPPMPSVELRPSEARAVPAGWIIPGTVRNNGDEAAQAVVLQATATIEGEEETSEVEIDYLPPGSEAEIGFGFSAAPDGDVAVRIVSLLRGG